MTALSQRDKAALCLIGLYNALEERGPTLAEIAGPLDFTDARAARRCVERLIRRGLVSRSGPRQHGTRSGELRISHPRIQSGQHQASPLQ